MKNISFKEVKKALGSRNFVRVIGSMDGLISIQVRSLEMIDIDKLEVLGVDYTWDKINGTPIFYLDPKNINDLNFVL